MDCMRDDLDDLQAKLRAFAAERDWDQFHSPKNLATALTVETAELLEHFQWMTEADSRLLSDDAKRAVAAEMADVLLYLLQLSDKLGVDLVEAAQSKIAANALKYPVDRARGRSDKYDKL
jgi:dCTP diphosphatase